MNRHIWRYLSCIVALIFALVPSGAIAEGEWEKIFTELSAGKEIVPGVIQSSKVYSASLDYIITDNNGIPNDFYANDTVKLNVSGNGKAVSFEGDKDALVAWAKANQDSLFSAIFGDSPDVSMGGMTSGQSTNQQLFSTEQASPENKNMGFAPLNVKDVILNSQYDLMLINDFDASGSSGVLNYNMKIGEDRDKAFGITVPYRHLALDDNIDSNYNHVSFMPFFKKSWFGDASIIELNTVALIGLTYLESALFPDGGGYMEYGAGTGVKYAYALDDSLSLNCGLSYLGTKKSIPSDMVPEEIRWVADAINDADMEHDLIPSVGAFYTIMPGKLSLRGELFRVHQLQSDAPEDYKNQTVALGIITYNVMDMAKVSLGYKRSFELKDITDQSFIFDCKVSWGKVM